MVQFNKRRFERIWKQTNVSLVVALPVAAFIIFATQKDRSAATADFFWFVVTGLSVLVFSYYLRKLLYRFHR